MKRPSLIAQIQEVERELGKRKDVYPRLVKTRKLRQSEADFYMGRMEAVLVTLRWLQEHEAAVRAAVDLGVGTGAPRHTGDDLADAAR